MDNIVTGILMKSIGGISETARAIRETLDDTNAQQSASADSLQVIADCLTVLTLTAGRPEEGSDEMRAIAEAQNRIVGAALERDYIADEDDGGEG